MFVLDWSPFNYCVCQKERDEGDCKGPLPSSTSTPRPYNDYENGLSFFILLPQFLHLFTSLQQFIQCSLRLYLPVF